MISNMNDLSQYEHLYPKEHVMPNTTKPRKLLQVGTPIKLSSLVTLLVALDPAGDEAIVDVYNGQLRVTEPQPTLDVD